MKRHLFFVVALAAVLPLCGQQVVEDSYTSLVVRYEVPTLGFDAVELCGEKLLCPVAPEGYMLGGEFGSPAVPFQSSTLTVPFCDGFDVMVTDAVYDTVDLPPLLAPMPQQPPRSKSDTTAAALFLDKEVYGTDAYSGLPLASVDPLGVARDRRLATLRFAPVSINPVSRKAVVCRKATVTVRYINPDRAATISHYQRYHTPSFNIGTTLNSLGLSAKADAVRPTKMVVVAPESLVCRRLNAFVDWKRRQGLDVALITTSRSGGSARNELTPILQSLYDDATPESPAPTYVVIVGDHEQIQAHSTRLPSNSVTNYYGMRNHVTDLYYASWTSDYLPDAFYGRLSATDTITLGRIINKIILYESYTFDDDSYLSRAVLVSGVDAGRQNDNAYNYSDPTMDYAAALYVSSENGFKDVRYYKNRTDYAPAGVHVDGSSQAYSADDSLRALYSKGYGWINYSAHGNWNEWSIPSFTVSNVSVMNNAGMPSVMIGNCCLSNKFDKPECLGEALLRRADNAGAVAYVGASQETYWTHDFFWAVGLRNDNEFSGVSVPAYAASRLGMYDRLFHTHSESFDKQCITMGAMIYGGNMAVQSYNGDQSATYFSQYYWEIYHLMGDPSLMPWLGRANQMPLSADTSDASMVRFTAVPNAYVAVVDSLTLQVVGAAWCDAYGYGQIDLPESTDGHTCFLSATAQGYRPYISNYNAVDLGLNIAVRIYPNPATDAVTIMGSSISEVTLATPAGSIISTQTAGTDTYTLDVSGLCPGLYLIVVSTADGISAHRLVRL